MDVDSLIAMSAGSMPLVLASGATNAALSPARRMLDDLLDQCLARQASDLHLTVGTPPFGRIHNDLVPLNTQPISATEMEALVKSLLSESQWHALEARRSLDLAFFHREKVRFRTNIYFQRSTLALALRRLDEVFHSLNDLRLPPQLTEFAKLRDGLVLVTGPTGSGKSTTLAAILHQINCTRACHIITIEDPIEYIHRHGKSLVHQRELFADVHSFADALKAALREDPDVLLVGEMRDEETIRCAILAAETGHLVFSTLHTVDCVGSITRMVSVFPADEQVAVRDQLSRTLRAVVSQRLLRTADGSARLPVVEVLVVNQAVANLLRAGDLRQVYSFMQSGAADGMLVVEQSLAYLVNAGLIGEAEAVRLSRDENVFRSRLAMLRK